MSDQAPLAAKERKDDCNEHYKPNVLRLSDCMVKYWAFITLIILVHHECLRFTFVCMLV